MAVTTVAEATSTSTLMRADAARYAHGDCLRAIAQSAGRGQRGNSWESAPGQNLTFSLMLRPQHIPAARAFTVSMAVAVAIADTLAGEMILPVQVKWPNDIYVGDRKICGILIENSLCGARIDSCVAGIGINVNQTRFVSDAPNPTSMALETGRSFVLESVLSKVIDSILQCVGDIDTPTSDCTELHARYRAMQWRGHGRWPWRDTATGEVFTAAVAAIDPDGTLHLDTRPPRAYAFKEVAAVL